MRFRLADVLYNQKGNLITINIVNCNGAKHSVSVDGDQGGPCTISKLNISVRHPYYCKSTLHPFQSSLLSDISCSPNGFQSPPSKMVAKAPASRAISKPPAPSSQSKKRSVEPAEEEQSNKKVVFHLISNELAIQLVKLPKNPTMGRWSNSKG